jgi:hypothetical protein
MGGEPEGTGTSSSRHLLKQAPGEFYAVLYKLAEISIVARLSARSRARWVEASSWSPKGDTLSLSNFKQGRSAGVLQYRIPMVVTIKRVLMGLVGA